MPENVSHMLKLSLDKCWFFASHAFIQLPLAQSFLAPYHSYYPLQWHERSASKIYNQDVSMCVCARARAREGERVRCLADKSHPSKSHLKNSCLPTLPAHKHLIHLSTYMRPLKGTRWIFIRLCTTKSKSSMLKSQPDDEARFSTETRRTFKLG
jgi:hypothetical protein